MARHPRQGLAMFENFTPSALVREIERLAGTEAQYPVRCQLSVGPAIRW
jgi:hypothetical protein